MVKIYQKRFFIQKQSLKLIYIVIIFAILSCRDIKINNDFKNTLKEAKHFNYKYSNDSIITISVINPWQGAKNVELKYKLSKKLDDNSIKIPVKKVICMSTSHIAFINTLNSNDKIIGVSGGEYIFNDILRDKYINHEIYEVGYDQNINFEKIIKYKPDVIFAYGVESDIYLKKLSELGVNVIYVADYLEETPLGKLEWIKFFSLFFEKEDIANNYFDSVWNNYNQLTNSVKKIATKPKVLSALPWKGSWYVPGNKSYLAKLITDAGGENIFNNIESNESKPLSIENVLMNALDADIWINPDAASSLEFIEKSDLKLTSIKAFKEKKVFNNNKRIIKNGGNDYWESGVVSPDKILNDLILIFHPNISKENDYFYYQNLE